MKKVFLLIACAFVLSACNFGKNGSHTGFVTAIEQSGLIWKNYRVYVKTNRESSQEDVYCVEADRFGFIEELREVERSKKEITVRYDTDRYLFSLWRCDGDHITAYESREPRE